MKIRVLDDATINKIAAGEVIENPASIIKELVENSLDANAKAITVEIKDGGKTYIRVSDNGSGILKEDIPSAFLRHSTSKLNKIEDLFTINTMGFRGEALASIAAVADVELLTRTENDIHGHKYEVSFGIPSSVNNVATNKGTTIIVSSLFENLPVRKNLLRQDNYESSIIHQLMIRFCFSHPQCSFTFIKDKLVVIKTLANERLRDRIYQVLGSDIAKNMIELPRENGQYVTGYISNNLLYRSNRMHQYLSINKRSIKYPELVKGIELKYRSIIPLQKHPVFVLQLSIPQNEVDVNVHPNKTVVNIKDEFFWLGKIEQTISNTIKNSLSIPKFKKKMDLAVEKETIFDKYQQDNVVDYSNALNNESSFVEEKFDIIDQENSAVDLSSYISTNINFSGNEDNLNIINDVKLNGKEEKSVAQNEIPNRMKMINVNNATFIGQIFTTYIVFQYEDMLVIIDQHAAHERIKYEYYLQEVKKSNLDTQALLQPIIIPVNGIAQSSEEIFNKFNSIGYDIEAFDESSIIIRGVPIIMGKPIEYNMVRAIFDDMIFYDTESKNGNIENTQIEFIIEKIMKKSCINAIKSGLQINAEIAKNLLAELLQLHQPYTCPHGRPTMMILTKKEFEKNFLREMS
ncbi:MAG: DNA mismatch repair endonuclease MutL [Tissierellia bacterium]|nr:DNA mismatch repair endonuclease MutL [Tissierellia bacterium]